MITFINIYRVIAIRWMVQDPIGDKLILLQVLAWCHQTRHYLSQCWPRSMSPNGVSRPHWVNFCSQSSGNIMVGRLKLTFSVMNCFLTENVNSGSSLNNNMQLIGGGIVFSAYVVYDLILSSWNQIIIGIQTKHLLKLKCHEIFLSVFQSFLNFAKSMYLWCAHVLGYCSLALSHQHVLVAFCGQYGVTCMMFIEILSTAVWFLAQ